MNPNYRAVVTAALILLAVSGANLEAQTASFTVTIDPLISDAAVKEFADALVKAGQRVEYVQVGGASHAFFDWKPNTPTKATFAQYGVYHAAQMKAFFSSILNR